jgi:hypothetical protein
MTTIDDAERAERRARQRELADRLRPPVRWMAGVRFGRPSAYVRSGGAVPAAGMMTSAFGIPCSSWVSVPGGNAHGPDEAMDLPGWAAAVDMSAALLLHWDVQVAPIMYPRHSKAITVRRVNLLASVLPWRISTRTNDDRTAVPTSSRRDSPIGNLAHEPLPRTCRRTGGGGSRRRRVVAALRAMLDQVELHAIDATMAENACA